MKRFFCTICKKVKYVRVLPQLERSAYYIDEDGNYKLQPNVSVRKGECRWHNNKRHAAH